MSRHDAGEGRWPDQGRESGPSSNVRTPRGATLEDRFRGALIGLAVGDALGAPLEFQPARSSDNYVTEMIGGGWQQFGPGEWTDDTQLALCVVDSLLSRRVFDPDDIAQRFVAWMRSGPKDVGLHTRRVLEAIEQGAPWEEASVGSIDADADDAPDGSLIRSAPLAMFFVRRPDYAASLLPVHCRLTHPHVDCESGCVLIGVAIAYLLNGSGAPEAVEAGYNACETVTPGLRERVARAMRSNNETSPSGSALDTLEVALWSFLHAPSFEEALLAAVNRGAAAATVGGLVGALAGAHYGASAIPERWLGCLSQASYLRDLADRLLALAEQG